MKSLLLTLLLSYLLLTTANQCSVSIIGSGLSGVYTAYRLATANDTKYVPYEICLFDASRDYGGRVLTVEDHQGDLFEMGIGSFDKGKNPLFFELVDYLGLNSACLWGKSSEVNVESNIKNVTVKNESGTEAEHGVPVGTTGQKRSGFFGYGGQDATRTQGEGIKTEGIKTGKEDTKSVGEKTLGMETSAQESEMRTGVETKGMETSAQKPEMRTGEETQGMETSAEESKFKTAGLTAPEEEKQCGPEVVKLMLLRSKVVYKNATAENLPFRLTETVDKLKDLPTFAFNTVLADKIKSDDLDQIKSDTDASSRWEKISGIIDNIKKGDIKYKDVPINQLDMSMVIRDTLNLSDDDIEASIFLSDKYPRLRDLMSMNFELFAIQYLRNIAAGNDDVRTIDSFNGLSTVHDIMVSELEERGVQIYHDAKLDNVHIVRDTILLHFEGLAGVVPTERVFLAITRKELLGLGGSDVIQRISEPAREVLGSLIPSKLVKGVVFYDTAWWKDYDIGDVIYTDTSLNKLSFHSRSDCQEGRKCGGWIQFEHWGDSENLNYDVHNPIERATVLNGFFRPRSQNAPQNASAEFAGTEAEANSTENANRNPSTEGVNRNPSTEGANRNPSTEGANRNPEATSEEINRNPRETRMPWSEKSWEGRGISEHMDNETSAEGEILFGLFELEQSLLEREAIRSQFVITLIHKSLMNIFKTVPGFDPSKIDLPVYVLIANWQNDGRYNFGTVSLPSRYPYKETVLAMLEPIPGAAVHFVDSDFSEFTNWDHSLEGSIVMVERALNQVLGMEKPAWNMDEKIYKSVVEVQ